MTARWEHFQHQADMGVRGYGDTPAAAFEQAALAMTAVITDPDAVVPRRTVDIRCDAADYELLLVDWLNAVVYEMAVGRMVFRRFTVAIGDHRLEATAWGEPVDVARHAPAVEVKGATDNGLRVCHDDASGWTAQTVVDV